MKHNDRDIVATIRGAIEEIPDVLHRPLSGILSSMQEEWHSPKATPEPSQWQYSLCPLPRASPQAPKRPPPWFLEMAKSFRDAIRSIDRKLPGRILEALGEIAEAPMTPVGDTIKPLTGELLGYWRYRLGDYRLIYSPDASTGDITLLAFASRGSIYVD